MYEPYRFLIYNPLLYGCEVIFVKTIIKTKKFMQPNRSEQILSTSNINTVTSTERTRSISDINNSSLNSQSSFYSTANNFNRSDLVIQNVTTPIAGTVGNNINISYQVRNIGNLTAGFNFIDFFISKDVTYSNDDKLIGFQALNGLAAGTTVSQNASLKLTDNIAPGNYFIIFKADGINQITESNEVNNFFAQAISINPKFEPKSDLVIQNATTSITATAGSNINISYQVSNIGHLAVGFNQTNFFLSKDTTYSNDDTLVGFQSVSGLAAGTTVSQNASLKLADNIAPGNYFVIFKADGMNQITESNEVNNFFAQAISINPKIEPKSDLAIKNATTSITATAGSNINISYQVSNIGHLAAGFHFTDFFLSKDATYSNDDTLVGFQALNGLAAGTTVSQNALLKLADNIAPGNYFVIFKADGMNQITESNEVNNFFAKAISINGNNPNPYNSTSGYGLINAAAAVAKATNQNNFIDVANLGGNNWGADLVKAPEVWAKGYTGKGITVAVLDTGIDYNHVDLKANIWTNTKEIAGNGKDDDGNGYVDDVYGWNFAGNNNNTLDKQSHGTHVAGTIAGVKNSFGVTGIAYDAKLMAVKVLGDDGSGYASGIADGIYYAVKNGANVINLSLGANNPTTILMSALEYASSRGVVVVMAAGNEGTALPGYPARYADKWGLAVGAVDNQNNIANFSNRAGINLLAYVTAPGVNVYSTVPGGNYKYYNGTSMATPHVAGVVALMLSANPKLTDAQVRQIVTQTAVNGNKITTGSLNPNSLSNSTVSEKKSITYSFDSTTHTQKTVEFSNQVIVKIQQNDGFVNSQLLPQLSNSDRNNYTNSSTTRKPIFTASSIVYNSELLEIPISPILSTH
jgi:subtilisin family serine protease